MCCLVSTLFSKEIYKQLELIKEVLALSALMANNPNKKCEQRLRNIAFPEDIELEISEDQSIDYVFESEVVDDEL